MASFGVLAVDVLLGLPISEVTVAYVIFNLLNRDRTQDEE